MATIQRTFKDPALQNPLKYLGYDSITVEIEDSGNSENYFNVSDLGTQLHVGKNIFYIKPDPETLEPNAEIGIEILDADGVLIPVTILDNRRDDGSIGIVVTIDETRSKGSGQITLVSVARGRVVGARLQPLSNTDTFNIRWQKRLYINRDARNTSEITYITPPLIEVSELKLPYYEHHFNTLLTSSLDAALVASSGQVIQNEITCSIYQLSSSYNTNAKISYEKRGEQVYLELSASDFGGFVTDMENGTVFFDGSNIQDLDPPAAGINSSIEDGDGFATPEQPLFSEGSYFTSILQVLSPARILVSSPHTTFHGIGQNTHEVMHQNFEPSDFTLTWAMPPYSHSRYPIPDPPESESQYRTSYAGVIVDDLDPYSGEVHRIKTYVRAESRPDDYVLCSDLVVEAQEMLIVSESPHYNKNRLKNIPCGRFDRLNSSTNSDDVRYFAKYWTSSAEGLPAPTLSIVSESRSHPTVGTSANEIYDFIPMRPSLRVGTLGEASALDDNVGRSSVQPPLLFNLNSNVSASFRTNKTYVLEVSAYVKGADLIQEQSGVASGVMESSLTPFQVFGTKFLTPPRLDVFAFGDAFQDDTNRIGKGKLLGEINNIAQPEGRVVDIKRVPGYSGVDNILEVNFRFPFKADADATGDFRFEIERGLWYFQDISVKPYERRGVNTHNYNYLVPLPRGLSHPDKKDVFDFMFEFYNIEGHMCADKVFIDNICMDNEYTLAPTNLIAENIDNDINNITINGPLEITNITEVTASIFQTSSITNTFGDILVYNTQSGEIGNVEIGCGLGYMDKDNCCCHLHADTNVYIFIDKTSLNITGTAIDSPAILTRWVITKFEKDMRERYPYWKGNIYVGQGDMNPVGGTNNSERWLQWMSWPAVGNQNQFGPGSGITGSLDSIKWSGTSGTHDNDEANGLFADSDHFHAFGYSSSAYYLEHAPIIKDGVPDNNVVVFAIVDETQTDYHDGGTVGNNNTGTVSDFDDQITDNYKRDYGLFIGNAYPKYDCFTGYVYALPSSNNINHGARQRFALHAYAAIETSAVHPDDFVSFTPTTGNLSAITSSNPYAHGSSSVGTLSPHYQGGIFGLASQSIHEKHDFASGVAGWYDNLSYPVAQTTINKSGSWLQGQATFSADLFQFIDGNSIGVKVDGTTICINEANELFATNTGSFTGSFEGEIIGDTILNNVTNITITGGINTTILGDTFIIGGDNVTIFDNDVTYVSNFTASHYHITQVTESLNINNTYGDVLVYNSQSQEVGAIALGCGLGFMDKDNCCCHLHGDTNIYIFIDNTSMAVTNTNPDGGSGATYTPGLLTKWVITKFEKDMRERYPYWKGNIFVGQGSGGPGNGTLPAERWLSMMSWPAVGNQDQFGPGTGITGSMTSVKWGAFPAGTTQNDEDTGAYVGSDDFAAYGNSASAYYLENAPIMRDGVPDTNVIVFTMVDETDPTTGGTGGGAGGGYHYRHNDSSTNNNGTNLTGTAADWNNHLTSHYKADYGLFVGKAHPLYTCFSGYVYALPSSNNTTHPVRQHFALHIYGAIETGSINPAYLNNNTPTGGDLSAITIENPYAHGSASVGDNSPHYQGGIYGLASQSVSEKHDFPEGISGWYDESFSFPVSIANANKSGSWVRGAASFSVDLFEFVDGDSIGVRVDGTTICVNDANELFATNTGSFTGSFTGDINGGNITNITNVNVNGGVNTYIVGDTFIIGGDNITVFNGDVTYVTNLTSSHYILHEGSATGSFTGSFTGAGDLTGSFTGSFTGDGSGLTGIVATGGDDLGNHTATQDINLAGNDIIGVSNITASGTISSSGGFIGDLTGTASYGRDNDWYLFNGTDDPTIDGNIYHTGKVGIGDFSGVSDTPAKLTVLGDISASGTIYGREFHTQFVSSSIIHMSGSTKFGDTTDDLHQFTGSLQLSHSVMSVLTGSGKFAFGVDHDNARFTQDNTRIAQFYSGSSRGVFLNVTNWESSSAFIEGGGTPGGSSPSTNGPRAGISVNAVNSRANYGYGGTRGTAGGNMSYHPDTYEGGTTGDDLGDGGDTDSLGRRLLQEVLVINTGGNPQGSINIHARGDRGQQIRFFTGNDDARNTGGPDTVTQRMTIIHEGLIGIGTHDPQRRLHISESGNMYNNQKVPLRVNNFTEGTAQHLLVWDENTGDVYRKRLSDLPSGDGGVNTFIIGDTFVIGPHNTFINSVSIFSNITSSGNISMSNDDGIHIFGGSTTFNSITASSANISDGQFTGSFTGSFDGDARLTGSFTGTFIGDLTGTASYGRDNDWYAQGGATIASEPTITGDIYHNGKVAIGDFSSDSVTDNLQVEGTTRLGNSTDDIHQLTGSIHLTHSAMSVLTGSGKFAFGIDHSTRTFSNDSTRLAQFYSGSSRAVVVNVTNWETASAFTAAGGEPGDSGPSSTNGPRSIISVNGRNSISNYGYGGTRGTAGGFISFHPDTYEGNTNNDDLGDGGDTDSLGRRLLQEVMHISTGGSPQPSINIHARGSRGQQIRFFTGGDDTRNTGGKDTVTQRMTIIHEGLIGIGTHDPQRRLHISESGHSYSGTSGQLVPLRVNNFHEGPAQNAVIWDENTGDVYIKPLSEFTQTGGDTGIGTSAVGTTFIIGPFNVFINDNNFFGNVTASGNISASATNGVHIFGGSSTFTSITSADANMTGSFTGSFTGEGFITGSFSGSGIIASADSASQAACATQIKTVATNTDATYYPLLGTNQSDALTCTDVVSDPGLSYNPSTNTFSNVNIGGTATNATNVVVSDDTGDAYHPITFIDDTSPDGSVEALKANANITVNPGDASLTLAQISASGNISTSADLYFTNAYGADAVYHDNDANTGIVFTSDTITIQENNQQSAKFATTGGNSIGNVLYMTGITGSSITLGKSSTEHVTASADLWFQTDDSKILFGADKDIKLSHTADRGLTISNTGNLGAGSAESASSLLGLTLHNDTTTIADGDFIGGLFYTADSNATYNEQTYVSLVAQVQATTANRESANLYINVVHDGFDGGDAADQPAVSIKGGQNQIINHLGTKHEQLTTLSSSNNLPLILSNLKSIPTYTDFLTYDSGSGYVYKQGRDNVTFGSTTGGVGTFEVGTTFMIGPIVNITNNTLITNNFTTTGTGNLNGDVTIGTNCDNFLLIKSKVTASCIISSSSDLVINSITGSGTVSMSGTGHHYLMGALNVNLQGPRGAQHSNFTNANFELGDDVSLFDGSLIVGERMNLAGVPNNHIVNGAESLIVGQGNVISNQNARSIVMGYHNTASGLANFVGGSAGNEGRSDVNFVYGYGNFTEDNDGGIVLGGYNHVSATGTNGHHAFGYGLVNSGSNGGNVHNQGSIALGRYNKHGVTDAFLTIGDGKTDSLRRDLLVARTGSIELHGHFTQSGNVSITGKLEATQKSFVIPHPTKDNKKLVYGVLEGPEHAVYVRGRVKENYIDLPEEWTGLVAEDSITVQLTPIGKHQNLFVDEISNTRIFIKNSNLLRSGIDAFYFIQGTRKDIEPLETERDA